MMVVGVGQMKESTQESTYLETDLNTGHCWDIATIQPSLSSSTNSKLSQQPSPLSHHSETTPVNTGLHSAISLAPGSQGHVGSFPQASISAGNSQAGGYTASAVGCYSRGRNLGITGSAGYTSEDAGKVSSSERTEPRSGVYSLASSRPSVQQSASQPGIACLCLFPAACSSVTP